ncbi:hypothetical protein M446_6966 (plasmid) [Methylobacterium sp. 4-46]|uniref:hypothetical protein n=1 Tax=unclassified Methylobacterium TaxID=2615210 RepID=UPI000165CBF8|nr:MULTISPECIES: hypothetical protein [Methylobacterium]ACA21199.1 hypothetical protein M446_6966 [Methylobacterium sp. 4-46]WFT83769.1 hypothetical protein QA634_35435 [Methylobacterium nodulans]
MSPQDDRLDLLTGFQTIGDYLGWSYRKTQYRSSIGDLPTFKVGQHVCARRSTLRDWAMKMEAKASREGKLADVAP